MDTLAIINTATLHGATATRTVIEARATTGLPGFTITDQPDGPARETRDRVRAAILSSGYAWPQQPVTVTIPNVAYGRGLASSLDLAIAIAVLVVTGQLDASTVQYVAFLGELGLDGTIRGVPAAYALAEAITSPTLIVPPANVNQVAALGHDAGHDAIHTAPNLAALVDCLNGTHPWPEPPTTPPPATTTAPTPAPIGPIDPAIAETLEIAAAGAHHVLITGPSPDHDRYAAFLAALLPDLTDTQRLDVARLHSAAGLDHPAAPTRPPFRTVAPTASAVALYGARRPGEASCAHHGVLYLAELAEHASANLDALRQPLTGGEIVIQRAREVLTFPARFLLIAASRACPCNQPAAQCRCSLPARQRYARRLAGPTRERFDLHITSTTNLPAPSPSGQLVAARARVAAARLIATARCNVTNGALTADQLDQYATLTATSATRLDHARRVGTITEHGIARVRRVARTIDDLHGHRGAVLDADAVTAAYRLVTGTTLDDLQPATKTAEETA